MKPAGRKPTFTKRDLVRRTARLRGASLHEAAAWVDDFFAVLRDVLTSADPELRIEIREFGVFEVKRTKPKPMARNPRSGEAIRVPAHRKTHFRPGKVLKEFLSKPIDPEHRPARPRGVKP